MENIRNKRWIACGKFFGKIGISGDIEKNFLKHRRIVLVNVVYSKPRLCTRYKSMEQWFFFLISPITPNLSNQALYIHAPANLFLHKLEWKCLNYVQFQWALQNFYNSTVFLFKKKFTTSRNILFIYIKNDLSSIKAIEYYSIFYFPAIFLRKYLILKNWAWKSWYFLLYDTINVMNLKFLVECSLETLPSYSIPKIKRKRIHIL